uniref:Molybdopterin biosynthesis protein n=1 Tax=Helminthocladia australis TaxID=260093 RepID=A0A1G4NTV8_9FLOR|nr:Molybdopterin biosynthesis protein [Helminthocladia australis]SCW22044.1 Molybdopterin biosynthesis protein [Helminthocladia australis]
MNHKTQYITEDEYQVYARHIVMPEVQSVGQNRLKQGRILAIGAGGLGSSSLLYLASCGIGNIGIVDDDIIERSNLHRQILYKTSNIGSSKSFCAKENLKNLNPLCNVDVFNTQFHQNNAYNLVKNYDIILDNTDSYQTRWLISETCKKLHKIHVYGAISSFEGQVSVFNYQGGPSYHDLNPFKSIIENNPCNNRGVLGVLPGIIGLLQATEILKIILGLGNILSDQVITYNILEAKFKKLTLRQRYIKNIFKIKNKYSKRLEQNLFTQQIKTISLKNFHNFRNDIGEQIYLIDIRDEIEYSTSHLFSAIHIPLIKLKKQYNLEMLQTRCHHKIVVLYCSSLSRSYIASMLISAQNIKCFILNV